MLCGQHQSKGAGELLSKGWETFPGKGGIASGHVLVPAGMAIGWRQRSSE